MKKLHDLKIVLSNSALLSTTDCMRTKGGSGTPRRTRVSDNSSAIQDTGSYEAETATEDTNP